MVNDAKANEAAAVKKALTDERHHAGQIINATEKMISEKKVKKGKSMIFLHREVAWI